VLVTEFVIPRAAFAAFVQRDKKLEKVSSNKAQALKQGIECTRKDFSKHGITFFLFRVLRCFFNSSMRRVVWSCKKIDKGPVEFEKEEKEFVDKSEDMKMISMDFGLH